MPRLFTALIAVVAIGTAVPASAFSLQLNFPTLTYPTQPAPDVGQTCTGLTSVSGVACHPTGN